ncbi:MAG: hypothetical protein WBX02_04035 [Terriglobales bacterium]
MLTRNCSFFALQLVSLALLFASSLVGATSQNAAHPNTDPRNANDQKQTQSGSPTPGAQYSGIYCFLRDGEFVQITIDAPGHVIGFVSRYGDSDSDHDVFLDQFFKSAKLDGDKLTFATESVHGKSYDFQGTIERGEGKNHGDEAFYVLKGTLTENTTDEAKKAYSQSHEVALKSFPQDMAPPQADK